MSVKRMPSAQFLRLPKLAQDHIASLETELFDRALARIAELELALRDLLTADIDPIPPSGNSIAAWAERLAAARQNARRLLAPVGGASGDITTTHIGGSVK